MIRIFLRFFFHLLYNQFAWAYDLVSWLVSYGTWKTWVRTASRFITGRRILELGHGPGHFQVELARNDYLSIGIDISRQMGKIARRRLINSQLPVHLVRCRAQNLSFANNSFDSVVATFPNEFIFENSTVDEIDRVLVSGGQVIVIPFAWLTGESLIEKILALIFRITNQVPEDLNSPKSYGVNTFVNKMIIKGYIVESESIHLDRSQLFLIRASKT